VLVLKAPILVMSALENVATSARPNGIKNKWAR
jgi:hypothetical protein